MVAKLITPRGLMLAFNSDREVQRYFEDVSKTVANSDIDSVPKIIDDLEYQAILSDGSLTIDASNNEVKIILKTPGIYKGKTYYIDIKDATNGAFISGIINYTQRDFKMYQNESIILQDNGESWQKK
jgi:hypothetical protein